MARTTCTCPHHREGTSTREKRQRSWLSRPGTCENMVAMVPHQHLWDPDVGNAPQREWLHEFWNSTGDTWHKAYLEECLNTGDDSTCSPSEKNIKQRSRTNAEKQAWKDQGFTIDVTAVPLYRARAGNHLHGAAFWFRARADSSASCFPIMRLGFQRQFTGVLQGIAAGIGTSNFLRAFFRYVWIPYPFGSMKKIPRNLLALSSFGFSISHCCVAFLVHQTCSGFLRSSSFVLPLLFWALCSSNLTFLFESEFWMILFKAEAIFASSISKFGKSFPQTDREDFSSFKESSISTSLIHNLRPVFWIFFSTPRMMMD